MKYPFLATIIGLASVFTANAQLLNGGLVVDTAVVNSSYDASSLTLNVVNYIFGTSGDFTSTVPAFGTLTAYGSTVSGLSTSPTTENIPNFFVFSGPSAGFGASGSTPVNRFNFTLTSLTDNGGGAFNGSGIVMDSAPTGAFAATPASFTIGFSGAQNYSFTFNTIVPTPEPTTISLLGAGAVAAWAFRRRKV